MMDQSNHYDPIVLPHSWQRDIDLGNGETYRLLVAVPSLPAPPGGFPVMVLLDGHALFATAVMTARLQAGRHEVTGVVPAVIIGIGYPGDAPFDSERRQRDLLPVPGGADRFLDRIVDEILPAVGRVVPLDRARLTLVGHSYGGLFVLHTLFTRPNLFNAYIAGSPSIWWQDRAILRTEEAFLKAPPVGTRRLMIAVGGVEQSTDQDADPRRMERRTMARMHDNAAEMAGRLTASHRVTCDFVIFPGESHVSVIPPMLSRAVAFALSGAASGKTVAA
jgi:predicted alpha/beta superfamily hydrolase